LSFVASVASVIPLSPVPISPSGMLVSTLGSGMFVSMVGSGMIVGCVAGAVVAGAVDGAVVEVVVSLVLVPQPMIDSETANTIDTSKSFFIVFLLFSVYRCSISASRQNTQGNSTSRSSYYFFVFFVYPLLFLLFECIMS